MATEQHVVAAADDFTSDRGGVQMATSSKQRTWWALSGVLFAAAFIASDFLRNGLASDALPLPDDPTADLARYITGNQSAVLAVALSQILASLALIVFVSPVATLVRRVSTTQSRLPAVISIGGVLAAVFMLISALLNLVMMRVADDGNLDRLDTLRQANFITGGTLHITTLGLFVGAASIAAARARALPRWVCWLGKGQAAAALLSLVSLIVAPAALFILLGRLLGFIWCIAAGISLARGRR